MNIHVIGCGVVGGALIEWFNENTDHKVTKNDPVLGFTEQADKNTDAIFICIPVPTSTYWVDSGQRLGSLLDVINGINNQCDAPIFIRSTVLPGTCDWLNKKYFNSNNRVIFMPEFLTERRAKEDTSSLDLICGYYADDFAESIFPGKKIIYMRNIEAELCKYAHNVFGAIKVTYANMIYNICKADGISYSNVKKGMLSTGLIKDEHLNVPGPDGLSGFGGKCFPKDIRAFYFYCRAWPMFSDFLRKVIDLNAVFR
jgi:UDPglucose 6-dehydrogenase